MVKTVQIVGCRAEIPILNELILKYSLFSKVYFAFHYIKVNVGILTTNWTQSPAMKTRETSQPVDTDCTTRSHPPTMV